MLFHVHPIKRGDLAKDIPDIKAFYPCVVDGAKSHLKWAEAVWLLFREKVTEFLAQPVGEPVEPPSRTLSGVKGHPGTKKEGIFPFPSINAIL
ncbi:hypothetical protein [Sphingobacterium sp. NPDC055346]